MWLDLMNPACGLVLVGNSLKRLKLYMRSDGVVQTVFKLQDEQNHVVYGMPQETVEVGLADCILPITEIVRHLATGL